MDETDEPTPVSPDDADEAAADTAAAPRRRGSPGRVPRGHVFHSLSTGLCAAGRTSRCERTFPHWRHGRGWGQVILRLGIRYERVFRSPCSGATAARFRTRRRRHCLIRPRDRSAATDDGPRATAEPRGRGIGARRDADLRERDRLGHRDPRRLRLLPRVPRARSTAPRSVSGARASPSTRSRSPTSSTSAASWRRWAARRGSPSWPPSYPRASNVEHYARIVKEIATLRGLATRGQEITRLGQERTGRPTTSSTGPSSSSSPSHSSA